jgi:hypothetical protein
LWLPWLARNGAKNVMYQVQSFGRNGSPNYKG